MLLKMERLTQYTIAILAAFICALQLASFQFWLLPLGDDGTVGMGLGILLLLLLTSCILIPFSIMTTRIRIAQTSNRLHLWKQSAAQILAVGLSFGLFSIFMRSNLLLIRVAGGILACSAIVFEMFPRHRRIWNML